MIIIIIVSLCVHKVFFLVCLVSFLFSYFFVLGRGDNYQRIRPESSKHTSTAMWGTLRVIMFIRLYKSIASTVRFTFLCDQTEIWGGEMLLDAGQSSVGTANQVAFVCLEMIQWVWERDNCGIRSAWIPLPTDTIFKRKLQSK